MAAPLRSRRMARSMSSAMCWSGMSRYLQTAGSLAITSSSVVGDRRRVGVEQAEPARARDPHGERAQQRASGGAVGQVAAIGGQVLRDQVELDRAVADQARRLGQDVVSGRLSCRPRIFGMMQKLQRWSQPSETFRYAVHHAPVLTRGETPCARQLVLRPAIDDGRIRLRRLDRLGDAGEVARADECVDLRQLAREIVRVALGEAAGDDQPPPLRAPPWRAPASRIGVDRLLLGRPDEGAGVHDQHIGRIGVEHHLVPGPGEDAEHHLGIHLVLGTAEGEHVHASRGSTMPRAISPGS